MSRATPPSRSSLPLLVAEDDPLVARSIARILESGGLEAELFADGLAALERFEAAPGRFAAVLADAVMPGLGGAELLERIRGQDSNVGLLLLSGYGTDPDLQARMHLLGVHVLAKPFTPEALLGAVARLLDA